MAARFNLRSVARVAVFCVVAYAALAMLGGDYPHRIVSRVLSQARMENDLAANRDAWNGSGIRAYMVSVENRGYTPCWLMEDELTLEVAGERVTNADAYSELREFCPGMLSDLTVAGLFGLAERYLGKNDPIRVVIEIEYDHDYGFIRSLSVDERPTLLDAFTDRTFDAFSIRVREFQPID